MSDDLYFALVALLIGGIVGWVIWRYPEPGAKDKEPRGFEVKLPAGEVKSSSPHELFTE